MSPAQPKSLLTTLAACALVASACRSEPPAPPKFDPVSEAEATEFGKRFVELLATCEVSTLAPLLNIDVIGRRAVQNASADNSVKQGFLSVLSPEMFWSNQCQSLAAANNRYRFLGALRVGDSWRPLIRMLGDDGLNYVELELGRFSAGIQIADAVYYLSGEPMSRTFSRLLGSAQNALDSGDFTAGDALQRIAERQRAGDAEGALRLIDELPPSIRHDKAIMLTEIGVDPADDEARYLAAIERFEKAYPNDPALDLVSIDGFFLRKQFDRLFTALDRLDKRVNDPYLEVMRALGHYQNKDHDKALAHVERAIEREPTLLDAWDTKSTVCLARKDFACAVSALKKLTDDFELELTDEIMLGLENGAELVASEPYKAWRATASP